MRRTSSDETDTSPRGSQAAAMIAPTSASVTGVDHDIKSIAMLADQSRRSAVGERQFGRIFRRVARAKATLRTAGCRGFRFRRYLCPGCDGRSLTGLGEKLNVRPPRTSLTE